MKYNIFYILLWILYCNVCFIQYLEFAVFSVFQILFCCVSSSVMLWITLVLSFKKKKIPIEKMNGGKCIYINKTGCYICTAVDRRCALSVLAWRLRCRFNEKCELASWKTVWLIVLFPCNSWIGRSNGVSFKNCWMLGETCATSSIFTSVSRMWGSRFGQQFLPHARPSIWIVFWRQNILFERANVSQLSQNRLWWAYTVLSSQCVNYTLLRKEHVFVVLCQERSAMQVQAHALTKS